MTIGGRGHGDACGVRGAGGGSLRSKRTDSVPRDDVGGDAAAGHRCEEADEGVRARQPPLGGRPPRLRARSAFAFASRLIPRSASCSAMTVRRFPLGSPKSSAFSSPASSFRISASTRSWTAPFPRFSAISAWASGPAHVVPLSMQRRLSPAAPSVASFSHAWLSRLPISPFGSRVSARTRSVPFGSNASKSKTTVGLSALSSRRCIASDVSKKLVAVPKPRSPANER